MKYYCTKWCLTRGIIEFEGVAREYSGGQIYVAEEPHNRADSIFGRLGVDVFADLEQAKADARKKAERNLASKLRAASRARGILVEFDKGNIKVDRHGN
jgi:hypothetical protein